jgi:uncharacterized membrane protein
MPDSFQVIFTGELLPGKDLDQVIQIFSEQFKVERSKADLLIRGARAVVLKKGLELERANKYVNILRHIGMVVELSPKPFEGVTPQIDVSQSEASVAQTSAPETSAKSKSDLALEALDNGGDDTTEVLEPQGGIEPCPKCGSHRMELGVCQDCGIVAAKYLAAQARHSADSETDAPKADANPYSAPEAELVQPMEGEMDGPLSVPVANGLSWLGRGWGYFKDSPLGWILALVVWGVLSTVIGLVPFLGGFVMILLGPVIAGGLMIGCNDQDHGEKFTVSHLFAGFSGSGGQLVLVGVFYLVMIILATVVMGILAAMTIGSMGAMNPDNMEAMAMSMGPVVLIYVLLFLIIIAVIMMTYIFAPPLVALEEINAYEAMKLSFSGCMKNMLPLTVYGIAGIVLSLVVLIPMILMTFSLVPIWLGVILLLACGAVLFPIFTASVYSAYRDIYYSN